MKRTHRHSRQGGFSLVEFLVAITIALLVVAAVGFVFVASRQTQRTGDGMARIQETARTASLIIDTSVRLAGYLPDPRNQIDPTAIFTAPRRAIFGGTDASVASAALPAIANAQSGSDYVAVTFVGNDDMTLRTCLGDLVLGNQRALVVFFLSKQPNDDTPSLSCATEITALTATTPVAFSRNEPIQQGISRMDIRYGIDTNGDLQTDRYLTSTEVLAAGLGETIPTANWNHVTSVEIALTTQSEKVAIGQADDPLRVLDGRLNRPIRQIIALRNRLVP